MKTLLLPIDFSDVTEPAVRVAEVLAEAFSARVTLLHVLSRDPSGMVWTTGIVRQDPQHEQDQDELTRLVGRLADQGIDVESLLVEGPPARAILRAIESLDADLVIMGTHGHGAVYDLLMGSVSEEVMRKSPRPVLMVPSPRKMDPPARSSRVDEAPTPADA